jgi:L-iditol 2-dehydrogenase
MKAAVLDGINKLSIKEVPTPLISDDDILIKIDSCGICGTDLRIIGTGSKRINYPQILGHEIAGTVVDIGKNQEHKFKINDRLALSADIPCGLCEWCKAGLSNHCLHNIAFGHEYPGGFADYLKLDKRIIEFGPLVILPETDITQDEFALCEPLACCLNGLELCGNVQGKKVLIFGAGPVGCMISKLAKTMGASSIVICDIDQERLQASKVSEADKYVLSINSALTEARKEITNDKGFDVVITACSSIEAQEGSLKYTKNRGVIIFFGGLPQNCRNLCIDSNEIHYREICILGSHGSTPGQHKMAVDMLLTGKLVVKELISKKYPLDRISEAMDEVKNNKNNLKIVINP